MKREDWWAKLKSTGWLDEVPAAEVARIRKALDADESDPGLFFLQLASGGFDAECIEDKGDYRAVVREYWKGAWGALPPMKVSDRLDRDSETAEISVKVNNQTFTREFQQDGDYVAPGVHEFMNDIVKSLGDTRRFHEFPAVDQIFHFVFLNPAVYQKAERAGIIPKQKSLGPYLGMGGRRPTMRWS